MTNGGGYSGAKVLYDSISKTGAGRVERQVILYRLNEEGNICEMLFEDKSGENDTFFMYEGFDGVSPRPQYKQSTKSFGGKLLLGGGTVIFLVPNDDNRGNEEGYKILGPTFFDDYSTTPLFEAYGTRAASPVADILLLKGEYQVKFENTASGLFILDSVVKTLNDDGESVYKMKGRLDRNEKELFVKEENMPADLSKGDILRIATDLEGYVGTFELLYDFSADKVVMPLNPSGAFTSSPRYLYGKVVYSDDTAFTVEIRGSDGTVTRESFPYAGFYMTECNLRSSREVEISSATSERIFDSTNHPGGESYVFVFTWSAANVATIIINR